MWSIPCKKVHVLYPSVNLYSTQLLIDETIFKYPTLRWDCSFYMVIIYVLLHVLVLKSTESYLNKMHKNTILVKSIIVMRINIPNTVLGRNLALVTKSKSGPNNASNAATQIFLFSQ